VVVGITHATNTKRSELVINGVESLCSADGLLELSCDVDAAGGWSSIVWWNLPVLASEETAWFYQAGLDGGREGAG
jgi:hypothetical protein